MYAAKVLFTVVATHIYHGVDNNFCRLRCTSLGSSRTERIFSDSSASRSFSSRIHDLTSCRNVLIVSSRFTSVVGTGVPTLLVFHNSLRLAGCSSKHASFHFCVSSTSVQSPAYLPASLGPPTRLPFGALGQSGGTAGGSGAAMLQWGKWSGRGPAFRKLVGAEVVAPRQNQSELKLVRTTIHTLVQATSSRKPTNPPHSARTAKQRL